VRPSTSYDPRAWDVFSLSMVLWFMWEGRHPLRDQADNALALILEVRARIGGRAALGQG
jgi:hypothetical protein